MTTGRARQSTLTARDLIELAQGPMLTPAQRKALAKPCSETKRGHVAPPGTGPAGETCGTCKHIVRKRLAKVYLKCGLNRANWTGGLATDIRQSDKACRCFEKTALVPA